MLAAAIAAIGLSASAGAADISGAGATFPYPIYAKWAEAYKAKTGTSMNYQSIGSGGGIKQITAKTVDFGASDMPLKPEQLAKDGLVQLPMVMGGVVPVVNLQGIKPGQLKLDGKTLADIYLGKITKWNDPAIAAAQPGRQPARQGDRVGAPLRRLGHQLHLHPLPVERRSRVQEQGRREHLGRVPGRPRRQGQRGRRRADRPHRRRDRLCRIRLRAAEQDDLHAAEEPRRGVRLADEQDLPGRRRQRRLVEGTGLRADLTDQPGKDSWPITGATFILMHKQQDKPRKGKAVLDFFDWAYSNGDQMAEELDYVPMPAA